MLQIQDTQVLFIDVQGNLARVVAESELRIQAICRLASASLALKLPVLLTTQVPKKIGSTIPELRVVLTDHFEYPRTSFSVMQDPACAQAIASRGRKQVLLAGFEAHICLYQTAIDLLEEGYEPWLITDCISSRDLANKNVAIREARAQDVHLSSSEQALFSLLRDARHPAFKTISKLIR